MVRSRVWKQKTRLEAKKRRFRILLRGTQLKQMYSSSSREGTPALHAVHHKSKGWSLGRIRMLLLNHVLIVLRTKEAFKGYPAAVRAPWARICLETLFGA